MVETTSYNGRPVVLYRSSDGTAQSAAALDGGEMVFEYCRRIIQLVAELRPSSVLMIGGGANTIPLEILKQWPETSIDIVDPEPLDTSLPVHVTDGLSFVRTSGWYDLIIVDAYVGKLIPKSITSKSFAKLCKSKALAINVIDNSGTVLPRVVRNYSVRYPEHTLYPTSDPNQSVVLFC